METQKNNSVLRILSGILLIASSIYYFRVYQYKIDLVLEFSNFNIIIIFIASIAIITGNSKFMSAGLTCLSCLYGEDILFRLFHESFDFFDLTLALMFIAALLMCISSYNGWKNSIVLGIISCILFLAAFAITVIPARRINISPFIRYIPLALSFLFLGLAMQPKPEKITSASRTAVSDMSSRIEELTKLKGLLDKGILTQEEFDAKKRKIMEL